MKFSLVEKYRYWWPVVVNIPHPDQAGETIKQTLDLQFEAQTKDEAQALQDAYDALKTPKERTAHEHDQLRAVVKNWRNVEGDVPFSPEVFEQALQHTWFRVAAYTAYNESLYGGARLGN